MNSIKDLNTYVLQLENKISMKIKNEILIRIKRIEDQISNEIKKFERFIKQNLLIDSENKLKLSKTLINDNYCEKCSNFLRISPEKKSNNCFLCFSSLNKMSPDHILFCPKCNLNICFICITTPDFHLINLPCEKCELECEYISKSILSDNSNKIICNVCCKSEKILEAEYFICKKCNFLICSDCNLHCRKELFLNIKESKVNNDLYKTNYLEKKTYLDYLRSRKLKANKLMEIQFTIARFDKTLTSNHSRSYSSCNADNKFKEKTISNFSENTVASSFLNSNLININEETICSNFSKFSTKLNLNDNESINEEKIIRYKSIASALLATTDNKENNTNTLKEENKNISTKYEETINSSLKKDISDSQTISNGPKQFFDNDDIKINVEDKISDKLIENSMMITEKIENNEKSNIYKNDELTKKTNDEKISNNIYENSMMITKKIKNDEKSNIYKDDELIYRNLNCKKEKKEKFLPKEKNFKFDLNDPNEKIYSKITEFEQKLKEFCHSLKMNEIMGFVISFLNEINENLKESVLISNGKINYYPKVLRLIGSGSYGDVYELGHDSEVNSKVMKCFKINDNDLNATFYSLTSFFREWKNLRILQHHNIISFYGIGYKLIPSTQKLIEVGLILENLPSTLLNFFYSSRFDKLIEEKIEVINQLVKGLNHIHSKNKIHRDIKPNNILISNLNIIKIIDFGTISEPINPLLKTIMDDVFTIAYGPPEFIRYYYLNEDVPLDYGNDIWSLGLTIIEIIFEKNYIFPWVQTINEIKDMEKLTKKLKFMKILNKKNEFEKYLNEDFNDWLKSNLDKIFKNYYDMKSFFYTLIFSCFTFEAENRIKTDKILIIIQKIRDSQLQEEIKRSKLEFTSPKFCKRKKKYESDSESDSEKKIYIKKEKGVKKCALRDEQEKSLDKKFYEKKEICVKKSVSTNKQENFLELREDLKKLIKRKDIFKK